MNGDAVGDLRLRYWSLVVTACEWRAYQVDEPELMAAHAFASLNPAKPLDLRTLFRAVDRAVSDAYRAKVSKQSALDMIRGMGTMRQDLVRPVPLIALSSLREHDRRILQHAYWDELGPEEIAEVLGTDVPTVERRLEEALSRYVARLARRGVEVEDVSAVLAETKPGVHHRQP